MLIKQFEMDEIHKKQLSMMKALDEVCKELDITYFFVHGSLLGAVTINGFIPEDDDIDIALFRDDYNKLILCANDLLTDSLFLQSSINDDFPLAFAKLRDSNTAFIQPVLKNYKCNKGIYIDIFPIDYAHDNYFKKIIEKLLNIRINSRLFVPGKNAPKRIIARLVSYIVFPSYNLSIKIREHMYSNLKISEYVSITNGKSTERRIPIEWFSDTTVFPFEDLMVNCPIKYEEYLSMIYGEKYLSTNPASNRIHLGEIDISASILDLNRSYSDY